MVMVLGGFLANRETPVTANPTAATAVRAIKIIFGLAAVLAACSSSSMDCRKLADWRNLSCSSLCIGMAVVAPSGLRLVYELRGWGDNEPSLSGTARSRA